MDPLLYDRKRVATLADQLEALLDWAADANDWTLLEDMNGHGHSRGEE